MLDNLSTSSHVTTNCNVQTLINSLHLTHKQQYQFQLQLHFRRGPQNEGCLHYWRKGTLQPASLKADVFLVFISLIFVHYTLYINTVTLMVLQHFKGS